MFGVERNLTVWSSKTLQSSWFGKHRIPAVVSQKLPPRHRDYRDPNITRSSRNDGEVMVSGWGERGG